VAHGILYLLGNPDHYTKSKFVVFYWKSYVAEVLKGWKQDSDVQPDKVILQKTEDGEYIGLSTVDDYKYRPYELNDKSLYEGFRSLTTEAYQGCSHCPKSHCDEGGYHIVNIINKRIS